jgi:hypothetical protein
VADLIEAAAFPICVPIGDRSETSGSANLVGGGFVSDATHTGGVAILGREGDTLLGRFAFDLVERRRARPSPSATAPSACPRAEVELGDRQRGAGT